MPNKLKAWLAAGGVLLLFVLGSWRLPGLIGISPTRTGVLRAGLLAFGVLAAALTYLLALARARRRTPERRAAEGGDDLALAFAAAHARLDASRAAGESRIDRLPLALVLGRGGSTKTTVVTRSGLEPELLSGEGMRGDATVPTELINVWYAQGTVLLEAGGRLLDDADGWRRLVQHIRPSRFAAAMGRGAQASRVAIVCIGCDELLKEGADESAAAARQLRARLGEIAQLLGIRLPVYVLFTRADRLPYFTDFVRSFSNDEAQQVLGVTLPLGDELPGTWAEAQTRRLQPAFDRLVHSLSLARLDVLPREAEEQARAAAYEFPRELRKIGDRAVQFLVDLSRPSQLAINPLLRGFYFTGVRPIVVSDSAAPVAATPSSTVPAAGATSVFNPAMLRQQPAQPMAYPGAGRRIPQWVFLRRLFHDVILADEAARAVTAGGTRVDLLRRALIAGAAAVFVLVALAATLSFAGNRQLVRQAVAAAAGTREVGGTSSVVGEEDLQRLDALRAVNERLGHYQRNGRPLRLAWGLYEGNAIQPLLHRLYFDRFGDALWAETEERLLGYLRALPSRPDENSDFGRTQDALAAHLLTTSEHRRATPDLLTPVLLNHARPAAGDSATALLARQFTFFASELPHGNPFGTVVDAALVDRTQQFLRAFGREAYYRALVYEGNTAAPAVRFAGPQAIVRNEIGVPGAFTLTGWRHVQMQLDSVDELFVRYQWIYGTHPPPDKPRREDLARMYTAEYIRRWQEYLAQASVQRFASVSDAAVKLGMLGAPTSPLFGMLALASRETAMDSASEIGRAFQPLHAMVAPDVDARGTTVGVLGYANALNALASQINLLGNAAGLARDQAALQAAAAAADVRREAAALAAGFAMAGDAAVTATQLQRLLRQPADFTESLISALPSAELNAAGRAFCNAYQPIARRFPFTANATTDAAVEDVSAIFARDSGVLWSFYEDALQSLLTPQGRARPGARVRPEFARFFGRAAELTNAIFRTADVSVVFDFQPGIPAGVSEVVLNVDGDQASFTPTARASRAFVWEAGRAREARLVAVVDGEPVTIASGQGPWAVFRLFHAAQWSGDGPYQVTWAVRGRDVTITAQVSFEAGVPPVFRPGYLSALASCVAQITN